jgi:hypothetical protein
MLSRPTQRKSWIFSYPITCPDISTPLREELDLEESCATYVDGRRYMVLYLERKARHSTVEQALMRCSATDFELYSLEIAAGVDDGSLARQWYNLILAHFGEGDARATQWIKPGKMRSVMPVRLAGLKRPREDVVHQAEDPVVRVQSLASRDVFLDQALMERDQKTKQALEEKDREHQLALSDRDAAYALKLSAKNDTHRAALVGVEVAEKRAIEAEARSAALEAGMRKAGGGEVSLREIVLQIDLDASEREVKGLQTQLKASNEAAVLRALQFEEERKRLCEKIHGLESDIHFLRAEAGCWMSKGESSANKLSEAEQQLAKAVGEVRQLKAECSSNAALVAKLREGAVEIVRGETVAEFARRDIEVVATKEAAKKEAAFAKGKWVKRVSVLQAQVTGLKEQLRCFVSGGGVQ